MFYLISQTANGHRLIDCSDKAEDLTPQIHSLVKENPASTPVVMTDKVLSRTYLVDKFGVVVQEQNDNLIQLEDLI